MSHPTSHPSARRNFHRAFAIVITVMLLLSVSCNLPFVKPKTTPTTTPVDNQPPVKAEDLPPAVVETFPLPLSPLTPGGKLTLYFNQPMDTRSVEGALQVEPALGGTYTWLDDSTLEYMPDQALPSGSKLTLTLNTTARAGNGLALLNPVSFTYQSPDPLRATEILPRHESTDVSAASAIVVTFNQPVVALGAEAGDNPPAFTVDPPVEGEAEWLNTSTYILRPSSGLAGGTSYRVEINPELTSTAGTSLTEVPDWSFTTTMPRVIEVLPPGTQPINLDAPITIAFNQPMDAASTEAAITLVDGEANATPITYAWNDAGNMVTIKPVDLLGYDQPYELQITNAALSRSGTPLEDNFYFGYSSVPTLSLESMYPRANEEIGVYMGGYGSISLYFTTPMAEGQDWENLVTLSPGIEMDNYYFYDRSIYISGFFIPDTDYTITISGNLMDKWGRRMGNSITISTRTSTLTPTLSILPLDMGPHMLTIIPRETGIPAKATNLSTLNISMAAYDPVEAIIGAYKDPTLLILEPDRYWDQPLDITPNRNEDILIQLQPDGSTLNPGLYVYHIFSHDARDFYSDKHFMAVVTRVQLLMKLSEDSLFVWAFNLRDDVPASGEPISIYDADGTLLAEGITDEEGILQVDLPSRKDNYDAVYAVMNQPGDELFGMAVSSMTQGIEPWNFGVTYQQFDIKPKYYLYTDRPIYRPGQTVYFRVAAHDPNNGRYSLPDMGETSLQVFSPYDSTTGERKMLFEFSLLLSEFGTAAGEFTLPEDLQPGMYTLESSDLEDYQSISFQVAEYRKPEIELTVTADAAEYRLGNDLTVTTDARYYFGAPAGSLPIQWSVYSRTNSFRIPGGYSTGKDDNWLYRCWFFCTRSWSYPLLSGSDWTDSDGLFTLTIPGSDLANVLDGESMQDIMVEFTIMDESGFPVSNRTIVSIHPDDFYIGIRSDAWTGAADQEMGFDLLTINWQKKPWGNLDLTATFSLVEWVKGDIDPDTGESTYKEVFTEIGSTDLTTDANGQARVAFTPPNPGVYMLEVRSGNAVSQTRIWVGGSGAASWPRSSNQRIRPQADADSYKPGDTARIFIANPLPGTVFGLATIERRDVLRWQTFSFTGPSYELEIPLTEEDAPNVFVSITLISYPAGQRPDFRMGYVPLVVDPAAELLEVEVQADTEQAGPGQEVTYTIQAADSTGLPASAEFSLSLVDKAVLALAEPNSKTIESAYYDPFPLGIISSLSLASYTYRQLPAPSAMGRGGGGGGEDMALIPPMTTREDFRDTAYWNPSIITNPDGMAQVTLTLPDNLTTWVADVRGLTTDVKVGSDTSELVTTKPLLVRPATPRFFVLGDRVELAAIIHNNTNNPLDAQAFLNGEGFTLDGDSPSIQSVTIEAGGQVRVAWWGTVEGTDPIDLTFGATAGELNDLTKPSWGSIPVLRYSSPQTFGTAGLLTTEGERLEVVSLPRTYDPTGGELRLEVMPSLAASIISDLSALEPYDLAYTEPALSTLIPNLAVYQALTDLSLDQPDLLLQLQDAIMDVTERLDKLQNSDGGWGWTAGKPSDLYLTTYALFALKQAELTGFYVNPATLTGARRYIRSTMYPAEMALEDWQINQLAFINYTLVLSGDTDRPLATLYELRERMDPWAQALLALSFWTIDSASPEADTLLTDLQSSASRSATGTHWQNRLNDWHTFSSPLSNTAFVIYAIAKMDPASELLVDAVRYLSLHRKAMGGWGSSYENAWILFSLVEVLKGTGELQGEFTWQASLNSTPIASGEVAGLETMTPITATASIDQMLRNEPNGLTLERSAGPGRLYYRAYLQVDRPVETIPALQRGLTIEREYYPIVQDCRLPDCTTTLEASLGAENPVLLVRLTLTVPEDRYYVVVKDSIPAGTEIVNTGLLTTRQGETPGELETYNPDDPFAGGWGWWIFEQPKIYDDGIEWMAQYLPAGTYQLTYKLLPTQAGEFRVLPARAWEYYFPEVEAGTPGSIFTITP
ncbi:MAG TPA: Ig-like domain-containing protein [Anaerolineaceae bacterium]|nr:Ig-like domain-containing protein [Anaerolineaceae bacterium]HQH35048.1 Ig-like domain-containing protein [Anaerolineaceae bacterium]HQJ02385.1 Ig-like domain-containing protein [Anaerolineaceae bacterium]